MFFSFEKQSYGSIVAHNPSKSNLPALVTANFEALKGGLA